MNPKLTLKFNAIFEIANTIDNKVDFMSMLGVLVDTWGVSHGLSDEELLSMLEEVADVQKSVHKMLGRTVFEIAAGGVKKQ